MATMTSRPPKAMWTAAAFTAAGATTIAYGLSRRSLLGKLLGVVPGVYLGLQGAATLQGESVGEMITKQRGGSVEQNVYIARPPHEVYAYFRKLENLPQFMERTHHVSEDRDGRIHWVIKIANGLKLEYDGRIIDEEPGKLLTYRSAPEEPFEETGTIRFEPAGDGGTRLTMRVAWTFPAGPMGAAAAKAIQPISDAVLAGELQTLKRSLESAGAPMAH